MPDIFAYHANAKIGWVKRLNADKDAKWSKLMWYMLNIDVGSQLRSQPILRWAIAQLRILSWIGLAHLKMGYNILAQLRIIKFKKVFKSKI